MSIAHRVVARTVAKTAMGKATVDAFLALLVSKIVQYEKRIEKKQPNIYRLGHFLEANEKVAKDCESVKNEDTPEALEVLKKSLAKRFARDFPPAVNVVKQIDAWLTQQKMPNLLKD